MFRLASTNKKHESRVEYRTWVLAYLLQASALGELVKLLQRNDMRALIMHVETNLSNAHLSTLSRIHAMPADKDVASLLRIRNKHISHHDPDVFAAYVNQLKNHDIVIAESDSGGTHETTTYPAAIDAMYEDLFSTFAESQGIGIRDFMAGQAKFTSELLGLGFEIAAQFLKMSGLEQEVVVEDE